MLHLTHAIDRATGYVFVPPAGSAPPGTIDSTLNAPSAARANTYALFSSAAGSLKGPASDIRDVQEKWIDERETWDAHEKVQWRREAELVRKEAARLQAANSGTNVGGIRERHSRPAEENMDISS